MNKLIRPDKQPSISVVMPVYNEERNLKNAIQITSDSFLEHNLDFEIIIVNDGSNDRTGELAEEIASHCDNIYCIHHEKNKGVGGAFKTGLSKALKEYVMLIPADNPLTFEDLQAYLPRVGVCDIIVGVRIKREGYMAIARIASFCYNRIFIPLLFNIGVSDANWIAIYKRKYFTEGVINFTNDGMFFLVEILILAKRNQLIIAEVPAKMKKRFYGKPTCFKLPVIWNAFMEMIRFFWKIRMEDLKK